MITILKTEETKAPRSYKTVPEKVILGDPAPLDAEMNPIRIFDDKTTVAYYVYDDTRLTQFDETQLKTQVKIIEGVKDEEVSSELDSEINKP